MRISTVWYCLKQGMINICRNILFSLASIATVSACIFLFCLFFSVVVNIQYAVSYVESTVGITIFFEEDLSDEAIAELGKQLETRPEISEIHFTSAEDAWNQVKEEYFGDMPELAEGFEEDNPVADSASYEIFLHDIETQDQMVQYLQGLDGIRQVNYSNAVASGLSSFNKMVGLLSAMIIAVLLAVAVFLISNTISVTAAFRKAENQIMRLIGATNFMIRAPFMVEGLLIGLVGAAIPLTAMYFLYGRTIGYISERFQILAGSFQFLPLDTMFPAMVAVALVLGGGLGFLVSFFTIRKHLKV